MLLFQVVFVSLLLGRFAFTVLLNDDPLEFWKLYGRGDLLLAVDGKLQTNFDEKRVQCLMIIGLWCAHLERNLRPSITQMPIPMYDVPIQPLVSSSKPLLTNSLQQAR